MYNGEPATQQEGIAIEELTQGTLVRVSMSIPHPRDPPRWTGDQALRPHVRPSCKVTEVARQSPPSSKAGSRILEPQRAAASELSSAVPPATTAHTAEMERFEEWLRAEERAVYFAGERLLAHRRQHAANVAAVQDLERPPIDGNGT